MSLDTQVTIEPGDLVITVLYTDPVTASLLVAIRT
jgi:hypothetical protein